MSLNSPAASVDESTRREQDIALLKSIRSQVLDLVVDSRAFSYDLSHEFGSIRDSIDKSLAYALLHRELESES